MGQWKSAVDIFFQRNLSVRYLPVVEKVWKKDSHDSIRHGRDFTLLNTMAYTSESYRSVCVLNQHNTIPANLPYLEKPLSTLISAKRIQNGAEHQLQTCFIER